jgi:hypothetical protein
VLKTALSLLEAGFWPVAIHPGQKQPIGKDWGLTRWDEPPGAEAAHRQ